MCIKVVRWFACPRACGIDTPTRVVQTVNETLHNDQEHHTWQHGDQIPAAALASMGLTPLKGWVYARHKEETWIRCALTKGVLCQHAVHEVRTEIFHGPCSQCSGEESAVRSIKPEKVIFKGHDEASPEETIQLEEAVTEYFKELLPVIRYWMMRLFGVTLSIDEAARAALYKATFCLEDWRHIRRDRVSWWPNAYDPWNFYCEDCKSVSFPYAANISRAARAHESFATRLQVPRMWYSNLASIYVEQIAQDLGQFDSINWMNVDENVDKHIDEAKRAIDEIANTLLQLGPTGCIQGDEGAKISEQSFQRMIEQRRDLAHIIAYYPCRDPGLSQKFRQLLLENHILQTFNPCPKPNNPPKDYSQEALRQLVEEFACAEFSKHQPTNLVRRAYVEAVERREALFRTMEQNREMLRQRFLEIYDKLNDLRRQNELSAPEALERETHCAICRDDFLDHRDIPAHFRPMAMPCCGKPIHFRCFVELLRRSKRCVFCRDWLDESSFRFEFSRRPLNLPPGLFHLPGIVPTARLCDDHQYFVRTVQESLRRYAVGLRVRDAAATLRVENSFPGENDSPVLFTPDPNAVGSAQSEWTWSGGEDLRKDLAPFHIWI